MINRFGRNIAGILLTALLCFCPLQVGASSLAPPISQASSSAGGTELFLRRYVKAKVTQASYKRERSHFGNWRGRVHGKGKTHVFLRFIKDGKVVGQKLIGKVQLEKEPNGVLFSYRGHAPKISALKWDIVAFSKKV